MQYDIAKSILKEVLKRWRPDETYNGVRFEDTGLEGKRMGDFRQWVGYIQELGRRTDVHFMDKEMAIEEFDEAMSVSVLPLIAFEHRDDGEIIPVMLYRDTYNVWKKIEVRPSGSMKEFPVDDPDALLKRLQCKESLYGMRSIDAQDASAIYILLPMVVPPMVSYERHTDKPYTPMRRLWYLFGTEKRDIFYIYVYAVMIGLLSLTLPLGIQSIIGMVSGGLIINSVIVLIIFVIVGMTLSGALQIMQMTVVEILQQRLFARAALEFSYRIPRLQTEALLKNYAPELMNRFFDILTLQKGFSKVLTSLITAALQILFGLLLLTFYHPFFAFFSIFLVTVLTLLFYFTGPKGLYTSIKESTYKYKVVHWLEELARNLNTFKAAGNTLLPLTRMNRFLAGYLTKRKDHFRVLVTQFSAFVVFKIMVTGGILILGSLLVINREITLGQFVASEIVIIAVLTSVEKLIVELDTVYDMLTASEKIGQVTDLPLDKHKTFNYFNHEGFWLRVQDLHYKYPTKEGAPGKALNGVNLEVMPGERVGIIGNGGSGKTTLMHLLVGLLDSYEGTISYNGFSIKDLNVKNLQDYIGDNLSDDDVFEGTLLENITMGRDAFTNDELVEVLELTELDTYIRGLEDGLTTHILASGKGFSSSFRKKVILARSLLCRPNLLVFDDFFYNLEGDYKERILARMLNKDKYKWSVFAASHDAIVLEKMDRIYLMRDGKVVRAGTFKELIQDEYFRNLVPGLFIDKQS
ncbi:MAG: ABC transporter ATP-binding protein [Bernardetiaceae bacterium]|nr:ABC transporter ATP-binding protein [Bernardetiaceae bacterium]